MKTILVLYENNGAGHRRAAQIIASMLGEERDCRVISVAGSELFGDASVEFINWLWIYLVRQNLIALADWLMNFHLRAWILPIIEIFQLADYHRKLDELAVDAIVCTADGYGKTLGLYAQERSIPLIMVNCEFSMFADLANPMATHLSFFCETINATRSYRFEDAYFSTKLDRNTSVGEKLSYVASVYRQHLRAGGTRSIYRNIDRVYDERNQARCIAVGPLVEPVYYEPKDKHAARNLLGIDVRKPCLMTISGSIGGGYLNEVLCAIEADWDEPVTLVAICGKDEQSFRKLRARKRRNSHVELVPLGFVDTMDTLYAAADVVIARPSASVFLEALMRRVPLVIPKRATANDLGGAELIKRHRFGEVIDDRSGIVPACKKILLRHSDYVAAINRFLAPYPATYAKLKEQIVQIILGHAVRVESMLDANAPQQIEETAHQADERFT